MHPGKRHLFACNSCQDCHSSPLRNRCERTLMRRERKNVSHFMVCRFWYEMTVEWCYTQRNSLLKEHSFSDLQSRPKTWSGPTLPKKKAITLKLFYCTWRTFFHGLNSGLQSTLWYKNWFLCCSYYYTIKVVVLFFCQSLFDYFEQTLGFWNCQ